jgi:hypothetical protein
MSIQRNILFDMIDDELRILMKHQGYLDMYHGVNKKQTKNYIKISCKSSIEKICYKYLNFWMHTFTSTGDSPTPLPTDPTWHKRFNDAVGNPDPKGQSKLAKAMQITYHCGVGELIWAMNTTRPDLAFASIKLSQANSALDKHHYHGLKHALKYLYSTRDDGTYFWRTTPCQAFSKGPPPTINSNRQDLILNNQPEHDANTLHAYADSDWATYVKTRWHCHTPSRWKDSIQIKISTHSCWFIN